MPSYPRDEPDVPLGDPAGRAAAAEEPRWAFGQRGAAAVELAIVLPFLVVLVMGVVDLGRVFYAYEALANAAREGARYCALHPGDQPGTWARVQAEINGMVALDPNNVTDVTCIDDDPGKMVTVAVTSTFPLVTPLIRDLIGGDPVLNTSASMVQWQ